MEPSRFDDLTKALATATSRRQALKIIAATTLGGILGLGGIGTAFAKCKAPGEKCSQSKQCCIGFCDPATYTCSSPTTTTTSTTTTTTTTSTTTTTTTTPACLPDFADCSAGGSCCSGVCCATGLGTVCCPSGFICNGVVGCGPPP